MAGTETVMVEIGESWETAEEGEEGRCVLMENTPIIGLDNFCKTVRELLLKAYAERDALQEDKFRLQRDLIAVVKELSEQKALLEKYQNCHDSGEKLKSNETVGMEAKLRRAEKERDALKESVKAANVIIKGHANAGAFYVRTLIQTQTELKEAEHKAKLHREFWQNSRKKRERLIAEIKRLEEKNRKLISLLHSQEFELWNVLAERDRLRLNEVNKPEEAR